MSPEYLQLEVYIAFCHSGRDGAWQEASSHATCSHTLIQGSPTIYYMTAILKIFRHLGLIFRRRIKSRLPFAGITRRLPYSTRFQDKV